MVCRWLRAAIEASPYTLGYIAERFGFHPRMVEHWAARDTDSQPTLPTLVQWDQLRHLLDLSDELDAEVLRLNLRKGEPGEAWADRPVTGLVEEWRNRSNYALTSRDGLRRDVPATEDAKRWAGFGSSLKPAHEPVICARKPLSGTIAQNCLEYGTGALNIDATRIGTDWATDPTRRGWQGRKAPDRGMFSDGENVRAEHSQPHAAGRWPANVVLVHTGECREVGTRKVRGDNRVTGNGKRSGGFANVGAVAGDGEPNAGVYGDAEVSTYECAPGCPVAALDAQAGDLPAGFTGAGKGGNAIYGELGAHEPWGGYGDIGGPSRYFYCAKASSAERDAGLGDFALVDRPNGNKWSDQDYRTGAHRQRRNVHSTVKPLSLMKWLIRLVGGQPGSTILDCFAGSGSTGCAAVQEGFRFIGIERQGPEWVREHPEDDDYVSIARARIAWWAEHPEGMKLVEHLEQERETAGRWDAGQLDLFGGHDA